MLSFFIYSQSLINGLGMKEGFSRNLIIYMTFIISQQFWNFWSTKPLDKYIWIKVAVGYCASKCPLIGVQNSKQVQVFSWQEQVDIWSSLSISIIIFSLISSASMFFAKYVRHKLIGWLVDWLIQCAVSLSPGNACTSIVSSGDIDAVLLHLFAISHLWPRNEGGFFKYPVHVILKKPNHLYDIYNITTILELLEHNN
jgi:hypothetical protein